MVLGTWSKVPSWFPVGSHLVPSNLAGNHRIFDSRFGSQLVPSTSINFPAPLLGTARMLIPSRPFFQRKSLVFTSKFTFFLSRLRRAKFPIARLVPSNLAGNHQNFDSQPFPFGSQHQHQFPSTLAGNELLGAFPFGRF